MIQLSEIVRGVAQCFRGAAYELYDEQPKQNVKSAVYITAEPIASETIGGGRMADREVLIDLAYVYDGEMSRGQYYAFIEECDKAVRPYLTFAQRKIMPTQITARLVDGVAHYTFMLSFFDALDVETPMYAAMHELRWALGTD